MSGEERIICAAVLYDDKITHNHQPVNIDRGVVVAGFRHHNCLTSLAILIGEDEYFKKKVKNNLTHGFLTSRNRFLTRNEAYKLHYNIDPNYISDDPTASPDQLYSEDLY